MQAAFNTKQEPREKDLDRETKAKKMRDIKEGRVASLWGAEAPACPSDTIGRGSDCDESDTIPNGEGSEDDQDASELPKSGVLAGGGKRCDELSRVSCTLCSCILRNVLQQVHV